MTLFIVAIVIGLVAGLRAFVAPAAVSWFAFLHPSHFTNTWSSFTTSIWTPVIFSILVVVEFITDQLPKTPSRKVPQQFIPRLISGAFCGAVLGTQNNAVLVCAVLGILGAAVGTFSGFIFRSRLAALLNGKDRPAAIVEDLAALIIAFIAVASL